MKVRHFSEDQETQVVKKAKTRLSYNTSTGFLIWRFLPRSPKLIGQRAGYISKGCRVITLDGTKFLSTHLIWAIVNDRLPTAGNIIAHKNDDRLDDRLENLKEITLSEQHKYLMRLREENYIKQNGTAPVFHHETLVPQE